MLNPISYPPPSSSAQRKKGAFIPHLWISAIDDPTLRITHHVGPRISEVGLKLVLALGGAGEAVEPDVAGRGVGIVVPGRGSRVGVREGGHAAVVGAVRRGRVDEWLLPGQIDDARA